MDNRIDRDKPEAYVDETGKVVDADGNEQKKEPKKKYVRAKRKIVYVDDLNHHLISTQQRLKDTYEIYPAQSAEILFEILENITPELILLDINMPEVNGFDIIQQLKDNSRFWNIPVIFLTGTNDKKSIIKGLELGAADFIIKPYSVPDLIEAIEFQVNPIKRRGVRPAILAIDDDPGILQAINHILTDLYTVYTVPGVSNEKAVHEVLKKLTPDLFLLDCNMPGMSGIEIVNTIRAIPFYEHTPIVFLTADGSRDNVYVAVSSNLSGFIVKPLNKAVLRAKMADLLKDYMKHRKIREATEKFDKKRM